MALHLGLVPSSKVDQIIATDCRHCHGLGALEQPIIRPGGFADRKQTGIQTGWKSEEVSSVTKASRTSRMRAGQSQQDGRSREV